MSTTLQITYAHVFSLLASFRLLGVIMAGTTDLKVFKRNNTIDLEHSF